MEKTNKQIATLQIVPFAPVSVPFGHVVDRLVQSNCEGSSSADSRACHKSRIRKNAYLTFTQHKSETIPVRYLYYIKCIFITAPISNYRILLVKTGKKPPATALFLNFFCPFLP
jgi:hypothetical protein